MSCRSAQKIKNRLENGGGVEDVEEMGIVRGMGLYGWKWSSLNCVSVQNPQSMVQSRVQSTSPVQSRVQVLQNIQPVHTPQAGQSGV